MPHTTSKVPAMINVLAGSLRIVIAIVAAMSGLIDCNELLRDAPILSTPV